MTEYVTLDRIAHVPAYWNRVAMSHIPDHWIAIMSDGAQFDGWSRELVEQDARDHIARNGA